MIRDGQSVPSYTYNVMRPHTGTVGAFLLCAYMHTQKPVYTYPELRERRLLQNLGQKLEARALSGAHEPGLEIGGDGRVFVGVVGHGRAKAVLDACWILCCWILWVGAGEMARYTSRHVYQCTDIHMS